MPLLRGINKDHLFFGRNVSPVVFGTILCGSLLGAYSYHYWGKAEGFSWGKTVKKGFITMQPPPSTTIEDKTRDNLYADPDEELNMNGHKHK